MKYNIPYVSSTTTLGAGVRLTAEGKGEILAVVKGVLANEQYKAAAKEISEGFKRCGGAKAAREFLERLC